MSRAEDFKALRKAKQAVRREHGIVCPHCAAETGRGPHPMILLPQELCKRHDYRDPRIRNEATDYFLAVNRRRRKS